MTVYARLTVIALQFPALAMILLSLCSSASWADSMLAPPNPKAPLNAGIAPLLSAHAPGSKRFFGVGRLYSTEGLGWNCTATLIASNETPNDRQPALILTAGHCAAGTTGDNEVVTDKPMGPGWFFTAAYFHDNIKDHFRVPIKRIVYSTMKSTDIAILELEVTYGHMKLKGIKPLILQEFVPKVAIETAHIPMGLFPGGFYLRHSACQTLSPRPVFEGDQHLREDGPWFWPVALPSDCKGVYGGSSGSPVLAKGGNRVIGVLFTAVDSVFNGCGWGRPCEITKDGVTSRPEAVYFNSVDHILAALKTNNTLDLSKLDAGTGVGLERAGSWSTRSKVKDADGNLQPAQWNLKIKDGFELIRYKAGPVSSIQCDQAKGYGEPIRVSDQPLIELPVGPQEGVRAICVIGKRPDQATWQAARQATLKLRQIDNTAPKDTPDISVGDRDPEKWVVAPLLKPNENVRAYFKYGPLASTECASMVGYSLYIDVPASLSKATQWRYCTYGEDLAGNPSPIFSKDITRRPAG